MATEGRKAVVLAGGGARGSYQIGVWKALEELEYPYSLVTGTSVGALNGAMMAQKNIDLAYRVWEQIETEKILDVDISYDISTVEGLRNTIGDFVGEALKERGISAQPLYELMHTCIDEEAVRKSGVDFGIVFTRLQGLKGETPFLEDIPEGKLIDYILGSASFFPAMQSHKIDGIAYVDGGYYDNFPISMALQEDVDEIVCVNLKSPGLVKKPKIPPHIKIRRIETDWDLGALLIFDAERSKRNIQLGYNDCMKAFDLLEGKRYSFHLEESRKRAENIGGQIQFLLERMKINLFFEPFSAADSIIKAAVLSHLDRGAMNKPSMMDVVLAGAENAGKFLDITPLPVYTFDEFDDALKDVLYVGPVTAETKIAASEKDILHNFFEGILPVSGRKLFLSMRDTFLQEEYTPDDRRMMSLFAPLYTAEFLAALYTAASGI